MAIALVVFASGAAVTALQDGPLSALRTYSEPTAVLPSTPTPTASAEPSVAASLPREPSPLVQVTMIDFLAASRDPAVSSTLEDVSRSQTYDKAVREAARRALAQL